MFFNLFLDQNTIKFCYSKVKNADMDLGVRQRVKAHDVRAFAASRAFYGGVNGPNYASLPLEITQHLHQVLSQGLRWTRPNRGFLPFGRFHCSTAGDASFQIDSRHKRRGHEAGNHRDRVCQNPLAP